MYNYLIGKTVDEAVEYCKKNALSYDLNCIKSYRNYAYDTKLIVRVVERNGKLMLSYGDFMQNTVVDNMKI